MVEVFGMNSQYLFNKEVVEEYISSLVSETPKELPQILIEIFFEGNETPIMNGNDNTDKSNDAEGLYFKIGFSEKYSDEYSTLIKQGDIKSLPIEYYDITWTTFARDLITTRSIPYKSSLMDSSEYRFQSGNDVYLSRIIKGSLETEDITSIAQAHRKMRDSFMTDSAIENINNKINQNASLSDKKIALSVELVTKNAWENSLVTQLDEIPFNSKLNQLIKSISDKNIDKQLLISTHSSFVANKLGLGKILLLEKHKIKRFTDLADCTKNFFKKIADMIHYV